LPVASDRFIEILTTLLESIIRAALFVPRSGTVPTAARR